MSTIKVDAIQSRNGTDAIGVDLSSSGNAIDLKLSGTKIGNIGVITDRVYLTAEGSHGVYLDASANNFCPSTTTGTDNNGNIDLGASFARWKDIHLSGNVVIGTAGNGIDFSATAGPPTSGSSGTSELLDDYEEGTMTLTMGGITNISNSNARITADNTGSNQARYIKIGTLCYIEAYFFSQSTTVQALGGLQIQGLPFPAQANGGNFVSQSYNLTFPSNNDGIEVAKFQTHGTTNLAGLNNKYNGQWDDVQAGTAMPNNTTIYFRIAGTYKTST